MAYEIAPEPEDARPAKVRQPSWRRFLRSRPVIFLTGAALGGTGVALANTDFSGTQSHTEQAIAGKLICPEGQAVVGAWIIPSDGRDSGWVDWRPVFGEGPNKATFTAGLPHGNSSYYQLHIGCGGTEETWANADHTATIYNLTSYVIATCTTPADNCSLDFFDEID